MTTLLRLFKFAWQDFWRNLWLSLVTILMIVLALLSVNTLLLFNVMTDTVIRSVEKNIDVLVYLKSDTSDDDAKKMTEELRKHPDVSTVRYITAAEALQEFQLKFKDKPALLSSVKELDKNPLPPRIAVQARDPKLYGKILDDIAKTPAQEHIEKTDFTNYETLITSVNAITSKVRIVVLGLLILFVLVSILIVYNTIRVSIYTHREEIGVMKLVGASNAFIRMPYIFESVVFTFISVIVSFASLYVLLIAIEPQLKAFFEGLDVNLLRYLEGHWYIWALWQFAIAGILNIVSSAFAVNRYVRT